MPTYSEDRTADGSVSIVAQVRIKDFKPVAKSWPVLASTLTKKIPKRVDGRRKLIKVPVAAIEWAEALEKELRVQSARGTPKADMAAITIGGLIKDYLDDPEVRTKKSFDNINDLMMWWTNHFGGEKVFDVGTQILRAARKKLEAGRANATVNRHLSQMRACWNWGITAEYIPPGRPWPKKLMLTEPRGRTRFLSDEEMGALLDVLDKGDTDPVMKAAIVVSIATGLRQTEVRTLKWSDVDFTGNKVTVRESKNGESRAVYVGAAAVAELEALKKLPTVSKVWVFVGTDGEALTKDALGGRWKPIRTAAKLQDFRWHDLRHAHASIMLQGGTTLAQLGKLLGHKSPGMTNRYAHMVPGAALPAHASLEAKLSRK